MDNQNTTSQPQQPVTEPVQVAPSPTSPTQTPKSIKTLFIAFVFVILSLFIAFLAGGYFLGKNKQQTTNNKQIASVYPTVQPTIDPTADWKTYSNNKYQYKYPKEWFISDNNTAQNFYPSDSDAQVGAPGAIFSVSTFDKKLLKVTFDDPVGTKKETADKVFTEKVDNLKIGDYSAFKARIEVQEGSQTDALPGMGVYVDTGTSVILIHISGNQTKNEKILGQILSTFEFTQ